MSAFCVSTFEPIKIQTCSSPHWTSGLQKILIQLEKRYPEMVKSGNWGMFVGAVIIDDDPWISSIE